MKNPGKFLSLILRHKPETIGIALDKNGWAKVHEVLAGMKIGMPTLKDIVKNDDKKRFEFNGDKTKIRASQGHSVDVDLELEPVDPPAFLYHGTAEKFLKSIKEMGILRGSRQYVHLSPDYDTAMKVGKRHGQPVVIRIRTRSLLLGLHKFFLSNNGVWLTKDIPPTAIDEDDYNITKEQAEKSELREAEMKARNDAIDAQHNLLLQNIKDNLPELKKLLDRVTEHWSEEDIVYRFYHGSFKVYGIIGLTEEIHAVLVSLAPYDKDYDKVKCINDTYDKIIREGTAVQEWNISHNKAFDFVTGPMLTAFWHAKYFLTMAVKYGSKYDEAPHMLDSGWAALLHLYGMR